VEPVRIAFLSSEVSPFAKSGGLADVAFSLAKTLSKLGHEPRVFMPLYAQVDRARHGLRPLGGPVEIRLLGQTVPFTLLTAELPGTEAPIYFVDCPRFYGRPSLYTNDADEPLRFLYFSRAVFEICQRLGFSPHILHANDWQTALVPLLKKTLYSWDGLFQPSRTVLTIHNIAYQGIAAAGVALSRDLSRTPDRLTVRCTSFWSSRPFPSTSGSSRARSTASEPR
jgi:starch synthase